MTARWHIVTPEFPPGCGGVGDYVASLAPALAAATGDAVTVWVPASVRLPRAADAPGYLRVLPDRFGAASRAVLAAAIANDGAGARLLVQYVANVFGWRGANLPFCAWLRDLHRRGVDVRVMMHEPYLYFRWRPDHFAVALAQRAMARTVVRTASHLYFSTETWRRYLAPFDREAVARATVLPIPSAIPRVDAPVEVRHARAAALGAATHLAGHFGTYGGHVAPRIEAALGALLERCPSAAALCVGDGSDRFVTALSARRPSLAGRVTALDRAPAGRVSIALQACDLLLQPYPDGVTTRRTSAMAGLANGVAVVTGDGPLTEPVWRQTEAVALVPAADPALLAARAIALLEDPGARTALAGRGFNTYQQRFDLRHTIAALAGPFAIHG